MKKVVFVLVVGIVLSSTVSADKIEYYSSTKEINKEMGKEGTPGKTAIYSGGIVLSAVIETVLVPTVWFYNLFQEEAKPEE